VILVDTSLWIDHLRLADPAFSALLQRELVLMHPLVLGELAVGSLKARKRMLAAFREMIQPSVATDDEVLRLIEDEKLFGLGIGYIDAHLLASARLTAGALLWTRDKRLREAACKLKLDAGLG
jgi:predicted nucleic acid-binding protein